VDGYRAFDKKQYCLTVTFNNCYSSLTSYYVEISFLCYSYESICEIYIRKQIKTVPIPNSAELSPHVVKW